MRRPGMAMRREAANPAGWRWVGAYFQLTKPRIIELLLITAVPAMIVAGEGWPGLSLVAVTLVGGALSAAGANAINSVIDRDIDRVMSRTMTRPLPAGRVDAGTALAFGVTLGVAGFFWLWGTTNLLAAALSTLGLVYYVFVYTLALKRTTPLNVVVGGAAGAVPTLVGWSAVTGTLDLPAWVMFGIVFLWTPPHFWALSLRYEDDYRAAGVPMLPVVVGTRPTLDHILWYTAALVGGSLLLYPTGAVGGIYLAVALGLGSWILAAAWRLQRPPVEAMRFFSMSNVYLAVLFGSIALDVLVL